MKARFLTALALAGVLLGLCAGTARADQPGYLYTYAVDESRFGDFLSQLDAYKPVGSPNAKIRPYVDLFASEDSKTEPGLIPRIYGDNYAGAAAGVQYTNGFGLRLFVQGGATTKLGPVAAVPSGGDVRGGAQLYREWGGLAHATHAYGNFFGSAVYYSRYQDIVSYNQLEFGRLAGVNATATEIYVRPVVVFDSHGYYYDNFAQVVAGARFHPFGRHGPAFAIEEAAGAYTHPLDVPPIVHRTYFDFLPTVSYGVNL